MDITQQFFGIQRFFSKQRFFCRFFSVALCLLPVPVLSDIYKCQRPDGSVQFTNGTCSQGSAEPVILVENSALDSTAERNNIAEYQQQQSRRQKKAKLQPRVLLIRDTATEERNARITAQERSADKRRKKSGKKRGRTRTKNKQ